MEGTCNRKPWAPEVGGHAATQAPFSQSPRLGLTLCSCSPISLNNFDQGILHFHFTLAPRNAEASAGHRSPEPAPPALCKDTHHQCRSSHPDHRGLLARTWEAISFAPLFWRQESWGPETWSHDPSSQQQSPLQDHISLFACEEKGERPPTPPLY